jgi:hypothetical protein
VGLKNKIMKGKLRKSDGSWVIDYLVESENPNAIFTAKTIALHPHDVDKMINEDQGREVDFDIKVYVPTKFEPTNGETVSFDTVKYARLTFTPGLDKETLDELFTAHEPGDFIDEKDEELLIELEDWDHRCGDGCCYTYGVNIFVNGEQIEDEDGSNPHQLLKAVLNKLGYTDVRVEYK